MQNNNTRTEEPNTTCAEDVNLQGIKTLYYGTGFLIKGFQMGQNFDTGSANTVL